MITQFHSAHPRNTTLAISAEGNGREVDLDILGVRVPRPCAQLPPTSAAVVVFPGCGPWNRDAVNSERSCTFSLFRADTCFKLGYNQMS